MVQDNLEKPILTGEELQMGNYIGLQKIDNLPKYAGWLALFGPGAVFAAMAQGSGELIFWPLLMAKFGVAFIGLLLPAIALHYPVSVEIGRYTVTTGETIFTGFRRIGRFYSAMIWLLFFVAFFWFGGYASAGATAAAALTHFPVGWSVKAQTLFWAYLMIIGFSTIVLFGRVVYNIIEKFMTAVTVITVVGLILACIHPSVREVFGDFFGRLITLQIEWPTNMDVKDIDILLTCIGFAGMGGFWNLMYSYWVRDKGVGMSRFMGRITSPITGVAESIPPTGYVFSDTPENKKNYKGWVKWVYCDQLFGTGINGFTMILSSLLAFALLYPKGLIPTGFEVAVVQAEFFRNSWGIAGGLVFLFVAAAFLADNWLGVADVCSRIHADALMCHFKKFRQWGFRNTYYMWFAILFVISLVTIPLAQPSQLLIIGGIISFLGGAIYVPALIYLNYYLMPKTYPQWVRPSNLNLFFVSLVGLIYLGIGIAYVIVRFF